MTPRTSATAALWHIGDIEQKVSFNEGAGIGEHLLDLV
jgi:hypothetical protein